jgi:hypothetical protein
VPRRFVGVPPAGRAAPNKRLFHINDFLES